MKINNPCSITELKICCQCMPFTDDNEYINLINIETKKYNEVDKRTIAAVFQITNRYSGDNYIDIGCAIISFMAQPDHLNHNVFINLKDGKVGISGDIIPNSEEVKNLCNNIKQIISDVFIQQVHE